MNNRRRQRIRALNMLIRSKSNGKICYDHLATFARDMMEAISTALNQACESIVELWESVQPFAQQLELGKQLLAAGYTEDPAEYETDDEDASCDSCYHYLGGGCCRINLEAECREGGGFEAWAPRIAPVPVPEAIPESEEDPEPEEVPEFDDKSDMAETILKWASIGICILAYPLVIYKLYEWIKHLFF